MCKLVSLFCFVSSDRPQDKDKDLGEEVTVHLADGKTVVRYKCPLPVAPECSEETKFFFFFFCWGGGGGRHCLWSMACPPPPQSFVCSECSGASAPFPPLPYIAIFSHLTLLHENTSFKTSAGRFISVFWWCAALSADQEKVLSFLSCGFKDLHSSLASLRHGE